MSRNEENTTLTINLNNGIKIEYRADRDKRIQEVVDGKVFTKPKKAALEIAAEAKACGAKAEASNYAVTFG